MSIYSTFIEEVPVSRPSLNSFGQEVLSKERPAYPIQFSQKRPESMRDIIRRMIAQEKSNLGNEDVETFEDADDFEVGDDCYDYDSLSTPYEQNFDHIASDPTPTPESTPVPNEPTE